MDYMFMDDQKEGMPTLLLRGRITGMMFANVVPSEGGTVTR